jgi:hypothetical protein
MKVEEGVCNVTSMKAIAQKNELKCQGQWDCNDTIFVVLVAINGGDSNALNVQTKGMS